jgi:pyrroline-5-carboxylate reductase
MPIAPLAVIGGGNMAQAVVRGGLEAGIIDPAQIAIAEHEAPKREHFRHLRIAALESAPEALAWLAAHERQPGEGQVLLAVKPQSLEMAGRELMPGLARQPRIIISMLAGASTSKVRSALQNPAAQQPASIIRVMPNLAVQIRRGTTALALGEGAAEGDDELAAQLFSALGRIVRIDEAMMDAFTAVAGSGPAYLFYLAEAMTRAAAEVGFDPDTAQWVARWTLTGSAALLDATDQPPGTLRAAVTSRGGTTAAAMQVLEESHVIDAFVRAISAARDRGRELAAD